MLTRFESTNFKSIKTLDLKMLPFMVLVGPNGAGKTNIVRALELFGEIFNRGTIDPVLEQGYEQLIHREKKPARAGIQFRATVDVPAAVVGFGPSAPSRNPPPPELGQEKRPPLVVTAGLTLTGSVSTGVVKVSEEELTLARSGERLCVRVAGDKVSVQGAASPELQNVIARGILGSRMAERRPQEGPDAFAQTLKDAFDEDEDYGTVLRLLNWQRLLTSWTRYLRSALRVTRFRLDASALRRELSFDEAKAAALIGPSGEGLAIAVERLRGTAKEPSREFGNVLQGLQSVFPKIENLRTERTQPGRLTLRFKERGITDELGAHNISDGVLHALALLVALEGGFWGRGVMAIEEPENAIHPWSLRAITERAQMVQKRQLLFTTHSETLVDAVKDPRSLFVVENVGAEGTTVVQATEKERALDAILRESGEKLGDLWIDGTLGGVPRGEG